MLRIRNLKCFYGGIMAIKGVSLSVRQGELVCLIGANGAGKSTLLGAVSGLHGGWRGQITFRGQSIEGLDAPRIVRLGISLVPEGRLIFANLAVIDNLYLGAYTLYRQSQRAEAEQTLKRVLELFPVLAERRQQPAGTLSGGEQQMLAIGRALMARPQLLLLDEPSMGLAPMMVEKILGTLVQLRHEGLTILLVEQNARAALQIADRAYVVENGQVVLDGPARELLNDVEVKRAYLGKDYEAFYEGRE
jgi:branched-chain amino acid transport system ATP-binding protein